MNTVDPAAGGQFQSASNRLGWVLGAVWLLAFASKVGAVDELTRSIMGSQVLPVYTETVASYLILAVELLVGLSLLAPATRQIGLYGAAGLSSLYAGYSAWRIRTGQDEVCHCFGLLLRLSPFADLVLSCALCASAFFAIRLGRFYNPEKNS